MSSERALYIYWKTASPDAALAIVRLAQDALAASAPGLRAELLRREPIDAVPATLMEIYSCPGGIDAPLQARIERTLSAATQGLAQGDRHVEVFVRP